MTRSLILASTSPYRQQLLQQLRLPFTAAAPRGEEFLDQTIAPELLVKHLALQKATSLRDAYDDALIIGSDQVFVNPRGTIIGKPGSAAAARRQLQAMSGKTHRFYTGIALYDCLSKRSLTEYVSYSVTLRELSPEQIAYYIEQENPIDCAGSFKIEGLGISLMAKMSGEDYTSLIGLPLVRLTSMLQEFGVDPLSPVGCLS